MAPPAQAQLQAEPQTEPKAELRTELQAELQAAAPELQAVVPAAKLAAVPAAESASSSSSISKPSGSSASSPPASPKAAASPTIPKTAAPTIPQPALLVAAPAAGPAQGASTGAAMGALPGALVEPLARNPASTTLPKKPIIFLDSALKKGSEKWSVPDGWRVVWSDRLDLPFFFNDPTQKGQVHIFPDALCNSFNMAYTCSVG